MKRLLVLLASSALILTACSSEPLAQPVAGNCEIPAAPAVIVYGARTGMPAPQLQRTLLDALEFVIGSQQRVIGIESSSDPRVTFTQEALSWKNSNSRKVTIQRAAIGILNAMKQPARAPEADLLRALDNAARSLRGDGKGTGTILVVDSGLSTAGRLDMARQPVLSTASQKVVSQLVEQDALPDLEGITVLFQGLGDVRPPQEPVSTIVRRDIEALWKEIAIAGGAACVAIDETQLSGDSVLGAPAVSPVSIPADPELDLDEPIVYSADEVPFVADTARFVNPAAAEAKLKILADSIIRDGGKFVITGTTAFDGSSAYRARLSLDRATAVQNQLIALGVDPAQLRSQGLGCQFSGYQNDQSPNGDLIESVAQQNRSFIVSREGPLTDAIEAIGCDQ